MAVKVGSFAKSTGGAPASQPITGIGFAPKALILWTVGATSANTYAGHIRHAFGISDGATSGCVASALDDATANTNAAHNTATKALCVVDGNGTVLAECSVTFDADGFTLSWTTNNATAYIINYMALGGDDLTNAKVLQWQTITSTGDQAVTGVGFQPDAMIGIISFSPTLDVPATWAADETITIATAASQWCMGWTCADAAASGLSYSGIASTGDIQDFRGAMDYRAVLKSLDADGWTYTWNIAPAYTFYAFQLCLRGGSYKAGYTTKSVSAAPTTQTITGLGFTPEGVLLGLNHLLEGQYGMCLAIGAGDGTDERCGLITDEYAAATIEAKQYNGDAKVLVQDYSEAAAHPDQVTDSEADLSLASGEFSLMWTTNDSHANKLGWFAFAGGSVTPVGLTIAQRLRMGGGLLEGVVSPFGSEA